MGFLKFLKREKKDALEELDLPPAPPPLEGFEEMPELTEFPEFPEEKISAREEMPKFDFPEEELPSVGKEETMQDFPTFPEIEEKPSVPIPPISAPFKTPEPMPSMSQPEVPQPMPEPESAQEEPRFMPLDTYPKIERRLFAQEKRILQQRPSGKTIYVKVDKFKSTLGSINMVRSDLRKSEEALLKLENIKNAKDKSFDKFKNSLDDLQKKLIFIDKTLFEGE